MTSKLEKWQQQIPMYEMYIEKCLAEVAKPTNFILPADFEDRIEAIKEALQDNDLEKIGEYLDVLAYFIEGKQNYSVIEMAEYLMLNLGKTIVYWQHEVMEYADNESYSNYFSMW